MSTDDFCADCPDREACMAGYSCDVVRHTADAKPVTPVAPDESAEPAQWVATVSDVPVDTDHIHVRVLIPLDRFDRMTRTRWTTPARVTCEVIDRGDDDRPLVRYTLAERPWWWRIIAFGARVAIAVAVLAAVLQWIAPAPLWVRTLFVAASTSVAFTALMDMANGAIVHFRRTLRAARTEDR